MGILTKTILTLTVLVISTSTAECQRQRVRTRDPRAILQNILSPANKEGMAQLLRAAAAAKNCQLKPYLAEEVILPNGYLRPNPEVYLPYGPRPQLVAEEVILPGYVPRANGLMLQNYPIKPVLPNCQQPLLEVIQPVIESFQPIVEVPRTGCQKSLVQTYPQGVPVTKSCQGQGPVVAPCGTPAPLVNPFLPAASPVSAIAPPVSSMLPPANVNSCRCNFLRKIPIPPPTL